MQLMLKIEILTVGPFAMNCYLVYDEVSQEGILIDPGGEAGRILDVVDERGVTVRSIVNTHCHIDHVAEASTVQEQLGVPFFIHEEEMPLLASLEDQGAMFNMPVAGIPEVAGYLQENDSIAFGSFSGKVLHTPGHSPGGISLLIGAHVFVGDCLFLDSIGRTDLYRGNYEQLLTSIRTRLLVLDDTVRVYPGHGPVTTIGRERHHNPFLQ